MPIVDGSHRDGPSKGAATAAVPPSKNAFAGQASASFALPGLGPICRCRLPARPPSKIHGNPATRRGRDGYCRRNAGLVPCARYFVIKSSSHKNLAGATLQGREVENLIACKVLSIEHKAG